jgi:hypothetical protein
MYLRRSARTLTSFSGPSSQTHKLDLVLKRLDEQEERNKKVDLLLERLEEIERRLEGRDGRSGGD